MGKDPRRHVRCLLCGKTPTINNWTGHVRKHHPERADEPRTTMIAELDEQPARASVELAAVVARTAPTPELAPLGPEDLDDIVMAVAEQLAGPTGQFRVADLPALFAWRAATSVFLRAVHDRQTVGRG